MNAHRYPLEFLKSKPPAWVTPGVDAVAVCDKLKAIRELREPQLAQQLNAEPRLAELIWFLQWQSHQPGGLDRFVHEFLLEFPERLRTRAMAEIPSPRSGRHTLENAVRIWGNLPENRRRWYLSEQAAIARHNLAPRDDDAVLEPLRRNGPSSVAEKLGAASGDDLLSCARDIANLLNGDFSELRKIDLTRHANATAVVETLTPEFFWRHCAEAAVKNLPGYLRDLCSDLDNGFGAPDDTKPDQPVAQWRWTSSVWFFDGLVPALLEMMDRHSAKARASIASTSITELMMDRMAFAISERANVLLAGDARLGKTVTIETNCRPGRLRVVQVPPEHGERDFIAAHAAPFHLSCNSKTSLMELREQVKYVLAHSGLVVAYDEFHFAIPMRPRRGDNPSRLDFIRRNVVDRKLGAVFCTTIQSYSHSLSEFVAKTRHAIEQWVGRIHDHRAFGSDPSDLTAPPPLSIADLWSIARNKFPEVDGELLETVAAMAIQNPSPAHWVESILKAARWNAKKSGRPVPMAEDIQAALADLEIQPAAEEFQTRSGPKPRAITSAPDSSREAAAPLQERGERTTLPSVQHSNRLGSRPALETV